MTPIDEQTSLNPENCSPNYCACIKLQSGAYTFATTFLKPDHTGSCVGRNIGGKLEIWM